MSTEYIPYCYLIGWSKLDTWYYGVEYANNKQRVSNPANLWTTYFTSSKHVRTFIEEHGEPDVVQVRKLFSTREKAQLWECTVLRRLKVREKTNWLNVNPGGFGFAVPVGELHPCFGKKRSEESRNKQRETRKQRQEQGLYSYNSHTPAQTEAVRRTGLNNKGKRRTEEWKRQRSKQYKEGEFASKVHTLQNVDGSTISVFNLKKWCHENDIVYPSLMNTKYKNRYHKTWKVLKS
jgi:hypothetical protein